MGKAAPLVLGMTVFGLDLPVEPKDTILVGLDDAVKAKNDAPGPASSGRRWRLWPMPFRRVKTIGHTDSVLNEEVFVDSESDCQTSVVFSNIAIACAIMCLAFGVLDHLLLYSPTYLHTPQL